MIELRRVISEKLKSIHPNVVVDGKSESRVHFQVTSDDTPCPYLVYDFPTSFTSEDQEVFNLDVDVWDIPPDGDTTIIETLAGKVWKELHKFRHIDDDIQFTVYRENRLTLTDDDSRIRRRKLIFQLRYFDRRLNNE